MLRFASEISARFRRKSLFFSSPKKMTEADRLAIKNVFVTLGDKSWLQKDKRY